MLIEAEKRHYTKWKQDLRDEGKREGKREANISVAKNLASDGISEEKIAAYMTRQGRPLLSAPAQIRIDVQQKEN